MTHRNSRRALAALAASSILGIATPSAAGQQGAVDLSGPWRFQTAGFDGDCTMGGIIRMKRAAQAGSYMCDMLVETQCRNSEDGLYEYWRVKETCTAKQAGQRVQITGAITQIEEAKLFGENLSDEDREAYVPDNFVVTLQPGGQEMKGQLVDQVRRLAARLWRDAELVS
jgi:hypothetical protein